MSQHGRNNLNLFSNSGAKKLRLNQSSSRSRIQIPDKLSLTDSNGVILIDDLVSSITNIITDINSMNTSITSIEDNVLNMDLDYVSDLFDEDSANKTFTSVENTKLIINNGFLNFDRNTNNLGDILGTINFRGLNDIESSQIKGIIDNNVSSTSSNPGALIFSTVKENVPGLQEAMRISNNGNVGIGTTFPNEKLEVCPDEDISAIIGNAHIGYLNNPSLIDFAGFSHKDKADNNNFALLQKNTGETILNCTTGQSIQFQVNNNQKMKIDSSGYVGIGTSIPTSNLHLHSDNSPSTLRLTTGSITNGLLIECSLDNDSLFINNENTNTIFYTNNSERMRINNTGYLGIGTNNPQTQLHISNGDSGDCILRLESDISDFNENHNPRIEFAQDGSNVWSSIGLLDNELSLSNNVNAGGSIVFKTNNTTTGFVDAIERMRISELGNVGFGNFENDNPESALHVTGPRNNTPAKAGVHIGEGGSGDYAIDICAESPSKSSYIDFTYPNTDYRGRIIYQHSANKLDFYTQSQNRMTLDSNGNLGIGVSSPVERLHVSGNIKLDNGNVIGNVIGNASTSDVSTNIVFNGTTTSTVGAGNGAKMLIGQYNTSGLFRTSSDSGYSNYPLSTTNWDNYIQRLDSGCFKNISGETRIFMVTYITSWSFSSGYTESWFGPGTTFTEIYNGRHSPNFYNRHRPSSNGGKLDIEASWVIQVPNNEGFGFMAMPATYGTAYIQICDVSIVMLGKPPN